jgi:SAM-dependent methyltransferase
MRAVGHADRAWRLLSGISRDAKILEVGASYAPLAPKRDGWRTTIVDHDTAPELRRKYTGSLVNVDVIEEVDIVWQGGLLHEAFEPAAFGTYDALIISHVLEHLPDPISFLASADLLLALGGVIVIAVPDKRFCFDIYRGPSSAGMMMQAHLERRTRHLPGTIFDEVSLSATQDGSPLWTRDNAGRPLTLFHPAGRAKEIFDLATAPDGGYIDCHAWQFTPASFELIFLDLELAGACAWTVSWLEPRNEGEILARLARPERAGERDLKAIQLKRQELLRATLLEIVEGATAATR